MAAVTPPFQAPHQTAAAAAPPKDPTAELRLLVDAFLQWQDMRIQTGERIRAVLQGRDGTADAPTEDGADADAELIRIRRGESDGPRPTLGRMYRTCFREEESFTAELLAVLEAHPAWPWLSEVKGVGPLLGAKLLSRLDARRAPTPSSFWAYCGLATVPGVEYGCETCGRTIAFPAKYSVTGAHKVRGGRKPCSGQLVPRSTAVRVAQPRVARGEAGSYNVFAKTICYLIGVSFLRTRSPYTRYYTTHREHLEEVKPGWDPKRRHLTAMRRMEKLFLADLWLAWREALHLPTTAPYALALGAGTRPGAGAEATPVV